jgi:hypothetical protein
MLSYHPSLWRVFRGCFILDKTCYKPPQIRTSVGSIWLSYWCCAQTLQHVSLFSKRHPLWSSYVESSHLLCTIPNFLEQWTIRFSSLDQLEWEASSILTFAWWWLEVLLTLRPDLYLGQYSNWPSWPWFQQSYCSMNPCQHLCRC